MIPIQRLIQYLVKDLLDITHSKCYYEHVNDIKEQDLTSIKTRIFHLLLEENHTKYYGKSSYSIKQWADIYQNIMEAQSYLKKYDESNDEDEKHEYGFIYSEIIADLEEELEDLSFICENLISIN